ncbi:MAG: hypothetical protein IJH37_01490 [Clostridia bacterium]|nr:hypothetical protein [Clostridia bacterium]
MVYNFNYKWKFKLANVFPLAEALTAHCDKNGKYFFEPDYIEDGWTEVSVPHTYNDGELFSTRIEDAGGSQTRTFAFYRKLFELTDISEKKIIIEFEGVRQSCFVYINGTLAGFSENGVAPFGFDITPYVQEGANLIAIATDNTATRNVPFCMAETPNYPDAEPGSYLAELDPDTVEPNRRGVGFFWNCNDFNPSVGGLTKNIRLHVKSSVYLTLPLYSNLKTTGTYIWADNFDVEGKSADINIAAEIRNESEKAVKCRVETVVRDMDGRTCAKIRSDEEKILVFKREGLPPLSITPRDAYVKRGEHYEAVEDEAALAPVETVPEGVRAIAAAERVSGLRFWSVNSPRLYAATVSLFVDGEKADELVIITGFRKIGYDANRGLNINGENVWLTGYAQRAANEWAAVGAAPDKLKDFDARLMRESNGNHVRWMHVAACPADIRACDEYGIVCAQPAGDKERENFGRQWRQRMELMRDVIIYFRNSPSILFWEVGNNAVNAAHIREMRLLKQELDPSGGRRIGCRTLSEMETVCEAEYVGTMLNRNAGRFQSELMPILETEYLREESPRRVWDDFSPPDFDYDNRWAGKGGVKKPGIDVHDLTAEEFAVCAAMGYSEFFNDRMGGASGRDLYSAAAALCWSDSAQHGRQSASENARMSGRVDAARVKKQSFEVFRVMQSEKAAVKIMGHWNYPPEGGDNYKYPLKEFNGGYWEKTGEYGYRDPKNKTVYVIGSYNIARIELYINDEFVGVCDTPIHSFVYIFSGVDVTQSGSIKAVAYGYDGSMTEDVIKSAGEPYAIRLTPVTGILMADGADVEAVDIDVVDSNGIVCPLCYDRIDFELDGEGIFLGGYNSGRFDGYGRSDSVIHKSYVYAECGTNRVFIRTTMTAGEITLKAKMGKIYAKLNLSSSAADTAALSRQEIARMRNTRFEGNTYAFDAIPEADKVKYTKPDKVMVKVVINGSEPDMRGISPENINGAVYGPIEIVLQRIAQEIPEKLSYKRDADKLIIVTGSKTIELEAGHTHMLINGEENLLNGEPYITDGRMIAEISAIAPHIEGASAFYDDKVDMYRIKL